MVCQNCNIREPKKHFCDMCLLNDQVITLITFKNKYNIVACCDIDEDTFDTNLVEWDSSLNLEKLILGVYAFDNCVFLSIWGGTDKLFFFDIKDKIVKNIDIKSEHSILMDFRHDQVVEDNNNVYIVNNNISVVKYDKELRTAEVVYQGEKGVTSIGQIVRLGQDIFIPVAKSICVFNIENEKMTTLNLDGVEGRMETFCYGNNCFWITTSELEIVKWNREYAEIVVNIPQTKALLDNEVKKYFRSYYHNDCLWIIPCYVDSIIKFDVMTKTIEIIVPEGEEEDELSLNAPGRYQIQKYLAPLVIDNMVYFLSSKTEIVYRLDLELRTINRLNENVTVKLDVLDKLLFGKLNFNEGDLGLSLEDYINYFVFKG